MGRFVRERFPLSSHVPMVAVFTLGNVAFVASALGGSAFGRTGGQPGRLLGTTLVALLYFFRLRCFDELKDHEVDRRDNPDRPLARGLVTRRQLGIAAGLALAAELGLAAALFGGAGMAVHAVAQGYSLLMYREFFLGPWLRPRLTTYAVTHTFSAVLLGASIGMLHAAALPQDRPARLLPALLFNWALFNLFEFARKTWAPAEERPRVDSYSRRFGLAGALALSASQLALGLLFTRLLPARPAAGWALGLHGLALLPPLVAALALLVRRTPRAGRLFRGATSIYLVVFYALLAAEHLAGRSLG
jgi:4-hydroxybenzoate polyprenyltransferase